MGAETIAVINQKGGVGKSTTVMALGAGLCLRGRRVLLLDADPQGNLSYTLGPDAPEHTVLDIFEGLPAADALVKTSCGCDLIPASTGLAASDIRYTDTGKEYMLKEALEPLLPEYDFIILDTPPALSVLTINALTAAMSAIIPAHADIYSLQGIGQLYGTIDAVRRYTNPELRLRGILLTRYNRRVVLNRDITKLLEETAASLGTKVFRARIREGVAVREAQAARRDLFSWAPRSKPASDYLELIDELLR